MKPILIDFKEITFDKIDFFDRYVKKVISNAKYHYTKKSSSEKYNIYFLNMDDLTSLSTDIDEVYQTVITTYITINEVRIPILNPDVAEALFKLNNKQRTVILRNVVLGDSLTTISKDMNISIPMVFKHKEKALEILKKDVKKHEEKKNTANC